MNGSRPIEDELLAKYVAREADATERGLVEQWVAAATANAQELERMRTIWAMGATGTPAPEVDVERAWRKVDARLADAEGRGRVLRFAPARRWLAAAALLTGLYFGVRLFLQPAEETLVARSGFEHATLSDSSEVVLSPGTQLRARMGDTRTVRLQGEAYFAVQRDEAHPFVITAGAVEVTVLGTQFTVTAYDMAASVLVRVREGRVQVVGGNDTLVLTQGEHARLLKQERRLLREAAPAMEVWGERVIQFEQAPLPDVAQQLERIFRVHIRLANPAMARCRLTATFENESVERILQVIADTYGAAVERDTSGTYLLTGDGCE